MRTVLIVEDSGFCQDALEVALKDLEGVRVWAVTSAEAALARIKVDDVCAIVTDLHLASRGGLHPDHMDGFELIAAVRSRPNHTTLPILVISGDTDPVTPLRLKQLGADAFFAKPFSPLAVRQKLEQLIHDSHRNP